MQKQGEGEVGSVASSVQQLRVTIPENEADPYDDHNGFQMDKNVSF